MIGAHLQRLYSAPCCIDCGRTATVESGCDHYCADCAVIFADGIAEMFSEVAEVCWPMGGA